MSLNCLFIMEEYKKIDITLEDVVRIAYEHRLIDRCKNKICHTYSINAERIVLEPSELSLTKEQMNNARWYLEYEDESKDGVPLLKLNGEVDGEPVFAGAVYLTPASDIVDRVLTQQYENDWPYTIDSWI